MNWFSDHCRCLEPPDVVLHLGAGYCAQELESYRGLAGSRVVLVEPQASLAGRLRRETAALQNFRVLQLAVHGETGEALLQRFNLAEFNSLRRPTGLTDLYPGLVSTGTVVVDTVTLGELVDREGINRAGNNWLVLDAPGMGSDVLDALAADDLGQCFSQIFLRAGARPLFEGVDSAERSLERLAGFGYELLGTRDDSDPDLPRYHLRLNPVALDVIALREQLAATEAELAHARAEAERQVAGLQAEIADVRSQHQVLMTAQEESSRHVDELTMAADKAKADLSVAIRLQALRDADLKELQARYAAAVELQEQQHELLVKLRQRLGSAADYLKQLTSQGTADPEMARSLVSALTGEGASKATVEKLEASG